MVKGPHPFVPGSMPYFVARFIPRIDESTRPPASLQGVHDLVMLALDVADLIGGFARRDEIPVLMVREKPGDVPNLPTDGFLRRAILVARLLDKELNGTMDRVWIKFAGVHVPQFVPFHGKRWPSYHRAAAELCRHWLSVYEQAAQDEDASGMRNITLGKMSLEEVIVKVQKNWAAHLEIARQLNRTPLVRIDWPMDELRTACEFEFDKATPAGNEQTEQAQNPNWPTGQGWEFRPGEAAFLGVCFAITGNASKVLQKLAERPDVPVQKRVLWESLGDVATAEENSVKDALVIARKILRDTFKIGHDGDPIPCVDRKPAAWKLDEKLLRVSKNLR